MLTVNGIDVCYGDLQVLWDVTVEVGAKEILVQDIFSMIRRINDEEGITILLGEQNVTQTLKMCHRAYALENGRIVIEGSEEDLMSNEHVREAYLGI